MAESQLRTLYESLRRDNYDVPGTYESFERTLTAPGKEGVTNRQTLYNSLHADGYDVPDTYESFANTLFVPQPKQQTAPAPQAVAEAPAPAQKTQAAGKATAPVQKAQPQVRAQTRPTSQQPAGTVAAFKLRRGGHDFYVTQQEVNEAGGLGAWAAKHPGAPVRVYMHGDGFTGHVDLSEASKRRKEKGYKYTLEYRPGHKVKRNKSGWVDNLVEYGQEAKAIEEMTAPTKQVVEQLWSAAEKKQTTDARNNYDALNNKWSRTGDDMPFVDSSVRYLANETDRMKNFDLDKMSEEAWRRSGAALTQKVYQRLKLANPKTDDSKLIEQAEAEAWRLTNKAVYDYAVEKNMPKSVLEYFFKKVMDQNSVVSLLRGTARSMAGTTGDRGAYEAAQEEYGKKHKVASVAGTVVGMGADPMMTLTGGAGGAAGKAVLNVGGRLIAKKAAGTAVETGTRLFANKLGAKVAAGVASGSVNLGMYEGLKEGERQFLHGGYINPETGQNEGYSLQAMFESAGKGAILGAATGVISPIFGNVGNKLVGKADRISSTGGSMAAKAGIRATQHLVATGLEGTIFATEGWLTTDEDKVDVWLDSMATMIGFKGHHIIKSAPRVIAGMRPVKPTADRPLTIDERNFNRKSFVERVSAMLDGPKFADERRNGSGMPLSFTKDDISTLKEAGYGSLADIFRSDRAKEADKPFEERVLDALGEDESTAEMSNGSGGLLDGYSEMEKLVKDASVPQEIRAKAYYALTGHCLGAGTITGHATRETDDGRIAVDALTNNGEIVYRRYYKSKNAANAATEKLDRQIELNKIDVGEQYADAVADETILDDVIKAQYPDNNPENIKKIYYGVKYGKARADEHLRKGIDAIDKEIEARKDEAADMRPDAIRKAYGEEYGVDIDDAIRKPSGDRSEAEKSAVESYIARLFASGETRVDRYDSKSDSYVSDVSDVADAADVAETQPETQPIGLATMKFQDGPVEVLSGRVVMTENGKMVDVERSDKTIVVRDPATGKTEMVSPEAMLSYEDVAPEVAADERSMPKYSSGRIVIRDADGKERRGFLTGYVDENGNHEYYVEGDLQHLHYASEHELNNILSEYQPDEPQQPSAEQPQAAERAYPEGVNDTEAYDNGLEDGAASTSMSDEDLNRNIERFSDENEVSSLTDYGRGWIEGLKQEQQRRIQAAQPEQPQQPEPAQAPAEAMQGEVNMPTGVNPVGTISVPQRDGSTRTFTVGKDAEGNNIVVDDRGFMWAHDGNGNAMQPYSPGANVPVWTDEQLSKLGAVQPANEQPATVPNQPENVPTSGETPQNPTENAVSPAESVPNPAAPVENVQETPAPTAEPTPLQRLPRDEKGEPIFEQAETPEIAWDALVEFSDGDVADAKEMADIVTEQKRKALEKLQKQKPKGASLAELRESQKVIKAAREQAEQEYNFWQQMAGVEQLRQEADDRRQAEERAEADRAEAEEKKRKAALDKRLRDTFEDVKDVPEAVEVLEDMDPRDIYEAAAQLLSGQKVLWSDAGVKVGARSETGFGEEERRRLFGLFASEANGGKSLSRLAEDAMKQQCETYGIPYDNQDARNALIDVISGARTVGDIRNYIANNRIDEARRLAEAKRRHEEEQYDEFCRQEYHLSAEEVEAYEDQLLAELSERDREFDANEYNDYIADEMARAAEITEQQKNGTEDNDSRRGSTPGDRRVQENDTEGKGTVPGRGYEVLPESRADQSGGAAADGDRSGIQPADGVQGDGPASAVAQGAQRGDSTVRSQTGGIGLAEARRGVKMVQAEGRTATPQIKLSKEEATDIIAKMEMSAVNDPQISLSPESWQQSFGLSNSIDTPLGKVKMGDGQYQKLIDKKRSAEFGMVVQTLQDPDVVFIEPSEAKEGQTTERNFSYVFVKTFIRDGQKFKYYTSVSVLKDGMEVSVSSHIASKTAIMKKLQDMERAYTKESLLPNSSEWHLAEHPTDVPDLLPTQGKSDVDVETSAKTEPQQPNNAVSSDSSLSTDEQGGTSSIEPNGESTVSDRKDIDFASDKQGGSEKSSADGNDASLKLDAEAKKEAEAKGGLQAVVEAASAEVNTEPTEGQKKAGNYKKGHVTIGSFDITIENPAGSVRRGVDADGKEWSTTMANAYGEIRGTQSVDGDPIDVFLATDMDAWNGRKVFVVDQTNTDGSFDEHKVMLGFNDKDEAMTAYLANYDKTWADTHPGLRISETNIEDFNKWVQSSHRKTKPFADYTTVSKVVDEAPVKTEPEQPTQPEANIGEGYKIEPKPYTNKQGKTLDTYLVTFDRDFSKEELSALRAKAKALKGWYDRESKGWMLRSSEDAKAFAEEVTAKSEDEVADEAPLSMADMEKPAAKPKKAEAPAKPTESPMKEVDVEGVFDALKTKGETKLSDHATPVEETPKPKKRRWISDEDADEFDSLRKDLRNHFGKDGDIMQEAGAEYGKPKPKQMDAEVLRMGTRMTYLMMKGGLRSFSDYCEAMKDELPDIFDEMRPHLKSLYAAAQNMEEVIELGWDEEMDDRKTVKAFDVYNFDKPGAKDIIATAQHAVDENASQQQTDQIIQSLKDQRNEQRKKEADETSADTETIIDKAETTASQVESKLEAANSEEDAEGLSRSLDKELEEVNKQLALLGYYEADPVDKDFNEAYGYMRNAERKAVQDAHRLATQLAADLGITIDPKDKVRKAKYGFGSKIARSNVAPAGGEVYITLPLAEGRELSIWLSLDKNEQWREGGREDRYDEDLMLTGIMYRIENTGKGGMDRYESSNHNTRPTIPYDELLADIRRLVRTYLPDEQVKPATPLTPQPGEDMVDVAKRVAADKEPKAPAVEPQLPIGDLFGGLFDEQPQAPEPTAPAKGKEIDPATKRVVDILKGGGLKPSKAKNDNLCKLLPQHEDMKQKHPDAMLLFRSGNNYYVLSTDAEEVANLLNLPLSKFTNDGTEIPFTEFPHHALDKYLPQMVRAGKRVAVCEQIDEPEVKIERKPKSEVSTSKPKSNEKTDVQPRTEGTGRGGQQPRPNEPLGEGAKNEAERTDGGRMAQRGGEHSVSDTGRGAGVSGQHQSERGVTAPKNTRNNHAERGTDYAPKGEKARIDANIAALELAKKLLASGATATPQEMAILRRYSGWGGLGAAFNEGSAWAPNPVNKRLREALTPEEYQAAVMSRNSAYYTPAAVIDAMWDVAKALGFKGGNIVEGSAGIGNIIGLMPTDISERSNIHAVEIDPTTGGILSLLYPDAKVDVQGFEQTRIANGSVDLAITNVPFVTDLHVMDESGDSDLSKKFRDIHDFCIAKNVRKLREGGIGIFITSSGTLDKSQKLRNWLVGDKEGNADVVGVFRMNNQTFGGTAATSDIIVVRKRVNGRKSANAIDVSTVTPARTATFTDVRGKTKDLPLYVNRYFIEHPEHMGGEMFFGFEQGDTYRPTSIGLFPTRTADQAARMAAWVQHLADMDWSKEQGKAVAEQTSHINEALGEGVKEGSMVTDSEGNLCVARMGRAVPLTLNKNKIKGRTKEECFKDYTEIKSALADVLKYQTEHDDDAGLQPLLDRLNRAYDTFVQRYGNLNKNNNLAWLRNDVDFSSIVALETYSEKGNKDGTKVKTYGKTDIFSRRVVEKESEPTPKNVKDGIIASIYKYGRIDTEYLATQLGKSQDDVKKEIVESGLGFVDPTTGQMEVSYEYLSGNVREKLRQAREANEAAGGAYDANVKALEAVVPMNIPAHLIEFALGSSWIEPQLYERYVKERTELDVKLTNAGGTWHMSEPWNTDKPKNTEMGVRSEAFGILIPGHKLIEAALTNKTITVSRTVKDSDGGSHTETDPAATTACATKVDEIRQDFKDWAREQMQNDPALSMRMEEKYNEKFNNSVPKTIPDEFVPEHFGGAATTVGGRPFKLRPHQAKAVIRATTQPVLLAHEVGTGKTYTLITTAMEMRRLGTARKPMIVVQNATVGQFVASAKALYPNAKVLTLEDADRNAEGRRAFYAKIKFNDWDMIVVPQSVFERIPDSIERQTQFIQDKIEEKMLVLEQMKEADPDGRSMIVRAAEREISRLEDEMSQLASGEEPASGKKKKDAKKTAITRQNAEVKARELLDRATDDVEDFDSMGIDAILVDEAHEYKHLGFATAMQRGVKGVDPSPSKKSQGVFLKAQAVLEKTGGKNVVFATGTPISNTAAEIWTFMRYLIPADVMKEYDIYYFDDFVRNFGNLQQMLEFKTNGKYDEVNRFAGYVNLPELVRIWSTVADTVLTREAGGVSDKIPQMEGGKAQDIFLPQTRALRSIMKFVKEELDRYDKMTGKEKKENSHIPLVMYGIAKAAAVDARLVQSDAEDDPNSKTNEAVRQTLRTLEETKDYKGTVAIFADNYQNKHSGFNLYEDIRKKLIAAGVPEEQVVVMKSGMTVKKKLEIFDRVNAGEVRVVMGSTFTLGTGVNIQERLHTLIHLDAPNRPMDYTQRNGRILRQGNVHNTWGLPVRVLRFGVEDSLDVTAYQRLKTKGAIADSIMNGKQFMANSMENRTLEEDQDLFGDITAQLSGSEYAMLKNQVEKEVRKLRAAEKNWKADQTYIHNRKRQIAGQNREAEQRITDNKGYLEKVEAATIGNITVGKLSFPTVESMEDFFTEQNKKKAAMQEEVRTSGYSSRPVTSDITISVGGFDFKIHTEITKEMKHQQGDLFATAPAKMTYSCPELGIDAMPVRGNAIKNAVLDIMENVVSGKDFRERIAHADNYLERNNAELEAISKRDSQPFKDAEALEKAEEKLAEYEELMKAEMAAKEAKYAEMDKDVEAAAGIELTEEDSEPTASEPAMDYSAENANFASSYETKDGKRINYTSENPEAYGGLFDFDFSNEVPGAENATEEGRVNRRQQSNPPLQRRNAALLDTNASARLNEANGEYCALERKFRESNYMEFTSTEKVESADDVAFIFEELENASVENVFVVMTKRGVPTVMHISIGGFNWSAMNAAPVKLAYDRIKPDKVYFVHNHPSGALNCSPQDVNCLKQIEGAIGKKTEGVIMDLKSGKYGTFDSSGTGSSASHYKAPAPPVQRRLRLYAFDRHVFNPDYQPSERMSNAEDVAKFLSSHRLGDRSKVSVLVCNNQNQIVANVHTTHTSIDSKGLADDIIRAIGEFGGMHAFLYGDFEQSGMVAYRNLTQAIKERSGGVYNLLDVVRIEGNHTWSARDNGYVYEPGSEYGASLEGDIRFREVEDDAVLNEFAEGKTVKAYRTMQVLDGKLYSPMATKVGGKATPEIKLGVPEQAEEHPEIIKRTKVGRDGVEVGYVVIDKGLGKGTLEVAYNPSIHASLTPLNDQFTSADMRPNLVIVETLIPKSELTSGYRAPMAKDAVGEMSWHSGTVSGKLAKLGKPRRVILSRYDMPVRIVPFKEVAQMIAAQLEGTDIDIPYNVVTPQVRMELRQLGFAISDTPSGSVGENRDFGNAEYITDQEIERINAHQQEMAQTSPEAKRSHAEKLAKKFNTPITIVDDVENLPAAMRNKKGGYDVRSGNVIVVIPNHADVEDVAETVFHEVVAHKGLREMLGEENYDAFCDEIYGHLKDDLKRQVDTEAGRRFMREPEKGYEHHRRVAVDELFGRMAEKGFEDFTKAERGIWAKLKAKVLEAINKFLGSLKLPKWVRLGDNELRYILWRSHERLGARAKAQEQVQNEALDFVDMARDVAKRAELGLNKSDVIVTRSRKTTADRIEESFDAAVAGELTGKPVEIGRLTKEGREYLEKLSGLKLKDVVSFVLNPSDLAHIYRRHFGKNETDARNIPLTKDDIRQMAYVVSSPDKVIFGKEKSGNQRNMFFFLKETDNGSYNLMEVYSDRKGNLTAKSYFKSKEGVSQRAMLLNESSTLTSVTDGATLSDRAKLPKFFESATISEEESFDFRYRDGETGDIWKDQSIGLKEKITYAALRLSKAQADDLTLRNDAMAAIGDNLKNLLHDMRNRRGTTQRFAGADHKVEADIAKAKAAQLRYDRSTVKRVGDLARILMQTGYLSDMTSGEILRLMSAVKNSVGGNDIESSVDKIMDIMIGNQLRNAEDALHSLLSIRGSKVDSRGVEVQGELDVEGQRTIEVVKRTINLNEDDITSLMDDARDRMGDSDKIIADNAAIEYAGLNMALDYAQNIANSKAEETALRYDLKTANEDMKVGRLTENAYKQLVDSIDEAIRKNKIERAEAYFNLVGRLSDSLRESIENAKAFRNAEKARVREIQHNANSDMEGRPSNEHHKDDWKDKMANNGFVQFVLAPLGTFDQILRTFGSKSANGEGYLWNRFMRGWVDCRNKELLGVKNKFARLDEKGAEIFGAFAKTRGDSKKGPKVKSMADMIKLDGKLPTATVKFWDGGEMREHELTQGNLLYIYMVDKMTDGRMKLRRMGITEEDIASVEKALDPRFKEFGDWLQEEFLVDTRNEYNETHKRIFGASMAAVENYFPLKILSNARTDKEEDVNQQGRPDGITTKTGSIIKRRTNSLALDIMGSNALSVVLDHITEMEHWNAYAEWNRDLNTLRTYKRFRNQVMNMTTAYGGGERLWKRFNDLCLMGAGEYRPPIAMLDKAAVNIAKGVTAAKVSFRIFTALKQLLSAPAYIPEVSTASIAKSLANPYGDFKWCMENLPIFYERWHSRISGDPRLLKTDHDWKTWREGIVAVAARLGMTPNAFVDALTVSIGARAIYQTRLKRYLKEGYGQEEAENRAKQDATILFNQTQQSSESPFLSTMQVDRSWLSVLFTVFRNSSMSYTRQEYDALRNLKRNLTPGQRAKSIEFMTKQILRDWDIDPDTATDAERDQAQSAAKKRFRRQLKKDVVRLATFGFILQLAWNLGAYLPYIIFGDDEDEKDKMWDDALTHAYFGSVEGLTGGDVTSSFGNMWASGEWNDRQLTKDMPLASDISTIINKFVGEKNSEAINDIINLVIQSGTGVNPQSITDVVVAITDACGDDPRLSHEAAICVMRILQVPQSQLDKMYFDEVGLSGREISQYTPGQLAQRYAEYKIMRGTPFVPWMWGDEEQQSKYEKSAQKKIKERLAGREDDEVVATYEDLDDRYKSFTKKIGAVKEMMGTDYIAAAQEAAELQNDPDFKIYQKRNALDAALDKAMRKWPPQRRERVKDLRLESTVAGVPQSKLAIKTSEQKKVSLTGELNRIANKYFTAETPEEARLIADTMAKYRALIVDAMQTNSEAEQEAAISELSTLIHDFRTKEEEMRSTKR